jgi:hypothetical protein
MVQASSNEIARGGPLLPQKITFVIIAASGDWRLAGSDINYRFNAEAENLYQPYKGVVRPRV